MTRPTWRIDCPHLRELDATDKGFRTIAADLVLYKDGMLSCLNVLDAPTEIALVEEAVELCGKPVEDKGGKPCNRAKGHTWKCMIVKPKKPAAKPKNKLELVHGFVECGPLEITRIDPDA